MKTLLTPPINISESLLTGQCFRWKREEDKLIGVIDNNFFVIKQDKGKIRYITNDYSNAETLLSSYFNLDLNIDSIVYKINKDKYTNLAIKSFPGLVVLNQFFFETLISFIISSFNNVKRIQKIVSSISQNYGNLLYEYEGEKYFSFPSAQQLSFASIEDLKNLGLGYRAKYVCESSRMFLNRKEELNKIRSLNYNEALKELLKFPGIGKKVADCILLYSLGFHNAYPVDVWVDRVTKELYKDNIQCNCKSANCIHVQKFAQKYFDGYAGWAQLYLFHYRRKIGNFT